MKTLDKKPITVSYVEFIPEVADLQDNTMYISEQYNCAIHKCLCGCGKQVVTPLASNMWAVTKNPDNTIDLNPSIGNYNLRCRSHYVIRKNVAIFM